jgi:hypothetical protein
MNPYPPYRRTFVPAAAAIAAGLVALLFSSAPAEAVSARTWKQRERSDFEQGEPKGVAMTAEGPLRLGARLEPIFEAGQPYVWAVAVDGRGTIYASGGNEGVIYKIDPNKTDAKREAARFYQVEEPEVQSLAVDAGGFLYAGTVPGGKVYKLSPEGKQVWVCETGEQYIWSLLFDRQGSLIAATGTEGRVLKIDASGKSSILYDSAETHIRSLALDLRGEILAGTDGHGLVFRIAGDGRGTVVYARSRRGPSPPTGSSMPPSRARRGAAPVPPRRRARRPRRSRRPPRAAPRPARRASRRSRRRPRRQAPRKHAALSAWRGRCWRSRRTATRARSGPVPRRRS